MVPGLLHKKVQLGFFQRDDPISGAIPPWLSGVEKTHLHAGEQRQRIPLRVSCLFFRANLCYYGEGQLGYTDILD